ncbi:MAG: dihydropyrimidinase [Clostridiales Family XIII bacterium]|jgi:dihydropyrimidinase|nr:dihydropyrimidinase [Clostridiales Family XIII bacterium]
MLILSSPDIRIENGVIAEMGEGLAPLPGEEVIDARGLLALPGGIDVHTHMDLDVGFTRSSDSFFTGTRAAACGGTTTIVDHPAFGPAGCSLHHQIDAYHELAADAVIDYGFHGVVQRVDDGILAEIPALMEAGVTSFKFYMTYDRRLKAPQILQLLQAARALGALPMVHCEDHEMLTALREELVREGHTQPIYHAKSRPADCEARAVKEMLALAAQAENAPLYIVHVSTKGGIEAIADYRAAGGRIYAETCPQYLTLDESLYEREDGLNFILSPPLRRAEDREALLAAIEAGVVDVVGTDHCPFTTEQRKRGADNFTLCPNGLPGVELRFNLLYSELVASGRVKLERFTDLVSTNPAKLFGLYPQKGVLAVGSDADLVLFDPGETWTVTRDLLHENVDYTPYEGMRLQGRVRATIARGETVYKDGVFTGQPGRGRFIRRRKSHV